MKQTIGFIGAGNMGTAIIAGIYKKFKIIVCDADKKRQQLVKRRYSLACYDLERVVGESDVLILAVKPQSFEKVLKAMKYHQKAKQLFISIAAGITTKYIECHLGEKPRVIRTMPNLPAQMAEGMTGIAKGRYATNADVKFAKLIFDQVGQSIIVEEKSMDALTAVSGSGPAYVFYFVECLMKSAKSFGLREKDVKILVEQTLRGSLKLLSSQKEPASVLRARVTSKGGTTQAALDVLKKKKVDQIFHEALSAARQRATKLAQ